MSPPSFITHMSYKPPYSNTLNLWLCFLLLCAAAGCIIASFYTDADTLWYGAAFALLLCSIQLFLSGAMSGLLYELYDGYFTVYRTVGKKRTRVFDLDLRLCLGAVRWVPKKELYSRFGKPHGTATLCKGRKKQNRTVIVYRIAGKLFYLYIETDDRFFDEIKRFMPAV